MFRENRFPKGASDFENKHRRPPILIPQKTFLIYFFELVWLTLKLAFLFFFYGNKEELSFMNNTSLCLFSHVCQRGWEY